MIASAGAWPREAKPRGRAGFVTNRNGDGHSLLVFAIWLSYSPPVLHQLLSDPAKIPAHHQVIGIRNKQF